jgi:hypothetical protein
MKYQLAVFVLIAFALLIIDRNVRILPYINAGDNSVEGFKVNSGTVANPKGKRCGVDLFPCADGLRCANGMCISQALSMPVESNPLPVYP